ncbi:hypothetical protein Acr_00g0062360 [Actinidia rufa]|uniref:Uncharacterized protein n=1 Tax=Actinidia rufa TaxID=165716 RepID=A0A7J0DP61_9ERIC|nr:hypothetical protein Acr_00g0062360 [Actinidia rufa]
MESKTETKKYRGHSDRNLEGGRLGRGDRVQGPSRGRREARRRPLRSRPQVARQASRRVVLALTGRTQTRQGPGTNRSGGARTRDKTRAENC